MATTTIPAHVQETFEDALRQRVRHQASWGIAPADKYKGLFDEDEIAALTETAAANTKSYAPRWAVIGEEDRERARKEAARGALRGPLHWLAVAFSDDELLSLIALDDEARRASRQRQQESRRVGRLRTELQVATESVRREHEAKQAATFEAEARRRLGWPKQGWPPHDDQ